MFMKSYPSLKVNMAYSKKDYEKIFKFFQKYKKNPKNFELISNIGSVFLYDNKVFIRASNPIPWHLCKEIDIMQQGIYNIDFIPIEKDLIEILQKGCNIPNQSSENLYTFHSSKQINEKFTNNIEINEIDKIKDIALSVFSNRVVKSAQLTITLKESLVFPQKTYIVKVQVKTTSSPIEEIIPYTLLETYPEEIPPELVQELKNNYIRIKGNINIIMIKDKIFIFSNYLVNLDMLTLDKIKNEIIHKSKFDENTMENTAYSKMLNRINKIIANRKIDDFNLLYLPKLVEILLEIKEKTPTKNKLYTEKEIKILLEKQNKNLLFYTLSII